MQKMTEERLQEIEGIRNTAMADIPATATDPTSAVDRGYHRRKARAYGYTARIVVPELIQAVCEQETRIKEMQKVVDAARKLDAVVTGDNYSQVEETELEIALFEALAVYDSYLAALDTSSASVDAEGEKRQEGVRD